MREIKFRAWDIVNKKMIQWESSFFGDVVWGMTGDKYVEMQFTGLKDKNGKEIYEGDIVKLEQWNPSIAEVVFDRGGFCFRFKKDDTYYPDGKYLEEGEVIGNIYENPELLTE